MMTNLGGNNWNILRILNIANALSVWHRPISTKIWFRFLETCFLRYNIINTNIKRNEATGHKT